MDWDRFQDFVRVFIGLGFQIVGLYFLIVEGILRRVENPAWGTFLVIGFILVGVSYLIGAWPRGQAAGGSAKPVQ